MKDARLLSPCFLIAIYLFSTLALHAQSTPCASITRAPQVLEALTDEHSQTEGSSAQEEAISAADMTRLKFTPIVIQAGDALYVEYRGKDFTINAQYANKDFTSFDSPAKASNEQWRKGVLLLDHLLGLNQKLVRLSVTAKNPGQVAFRNVRIIRAGNPVLEFARLASYGKPQIKKAIQKELPCKPLDDLPMQAEYSVKHGQPFVRNFSGGVVSGLLPPLISFQTSGGTPPPSFDLNHFKWNGKELDAESGLYNFGARYYSPNLSRFTSFDPKMVSKQKMLDPQQWNMYSYVRNNPVSLIDPDGREVQALDAAALRHIKQTLPANVRSSVVTNKQGFISGKALGGVKSNDTNFQALKHMVEAKGTIQVSTGSSAADKNGKTLGDFKYESDAVGRQKLESVGATPNPNSDYSLNFTGITYGANESKSGNIEVHVSDGTGSASTVSDEELTVTTGHELYVHGERLLDGRPADHEDSRNGEVNRETHEVEERTRKNAKQKDPQ
jgi:RHS repeat-associated protein